MPRFTEIRVEPTDNFFERGRRIAELADAGKPIPPSRVVAFEELEDMLSLLTKQRVLLLKSVKGAPASIAELARRLKRDRSAVTRDVQVLESHGVVQVSEKPMPGHGRQKWVTPIGADIQVTVNL